MPIPSPADFRNKTKKNSEVREMLAQMAENVEAKVDSTAKIKSLKDELIKISTNLFNDATSIKENKLISGTGVVVESATATDWAMSDYIAVDANSPYYFDGIRYVALYDFNKNFISRIAIPYTESPIRYYGKITTTANTAYIVVCYRTATLDALDGVKVNKGAVSLPYEPFYEKLRDGIEVEAAKADATTKANAAKIEAIATAATDATAKAAASREEALAALVTTSSNLFNDSTSIKENKLISGTGEIVVSENATDWAYSDFIAVAPSSEYYVDGIRYVALYDFNKNFISRIAIPYTESPIRYYGKITTTANTAYIVVCYRTATLDALDGVKVNKGAVSLPYEPFYEKLRDGIEVEKNESWVFGAQNIQHNAINTDKVDFVKKSTNLFNYATSTAGYAISSTGVINASANYSISDFIPVVAGKYTISGDAGYEPFINTAYYDADKNFISRLDTSVSSNGYRTLTIPEGVAYVRFNINAGTASQRNRMFNIGDSALPYENYYEPKIDILLSEKAINQIAAEIDTESQMDQYLKTSSNLFDESTAIIENKLISATGVISESATATDWAMSDYIVVDANSSYYFDGFRYIAFYTAAKTFISRVAPPNSFVDGKYYGAITTPSNAAFAIVMWRTSLKEYLNGEGYMINEGSSPAQYEEFGIQLSGLKIGKDISDQLKEEFKEEFDQIVFDTPIDGIYTTDAVWTEHSDFRTVTAAQVYQIYDDLLAQHPSYISKTALGDDSFGKPVAIYGFKPLKPSATLQTKTAKVFILCGQHGMEHSPPLATYFMLREMYNNWQSNPLLEALRFNVEFLVIPVLNCGGWDAYSAENANGVNLNRNYPTDKWINQPDGTSGTAPASEVETQMVLGVFDDNTDIDIFIDFHNFNGLVGETRMVWVSSTVRDTKMQTMAQALISKMTRHWRSKYEWIPEPPYFAGNTTGADSATVKYYAQSKLGISLSSTIEVSGHNWLDPNGVQHDVTHKRTATETILNWVLINLNTLM